ncbi:hypothetical protein QUA86_05820 [Microcoleus sp. F6_B6]
MAEDRLIFVKILLLAASFLLFPSASQQEILKTPISSWDAKVKSSRWLSRHKA